MRFHLDWRRGLSALLLCLAAAGPARSIEPSPALPDLAPIVLDGQAATIPLAGRSAYAIDPGGQLGIEQVATDPDALVFQRRLAGQRVRLDAGAALWVRFDVLMQRLDAHWQLELARSGTDRIALYHRDAQGRWQVQTAGDQLPVQDWANPDRYPVFDLEPRAGEEVRYWVRITHARVPFSGELSIHNHNRLRELRIHQQFGLGAYFGMAALLTLVALVNMAVFRDAAFAAYAVYTALLGLSLAASLGVGGQFLWPANARWNQMAEFMLLPLAGMAAIVFVRQVLQPRRLGRTLDRLCWLLVPAWLLVMTWDVLLPSDTSLSVSTALGGLGMALVTVMLLGAARSSETWVRLIALGLAPILLASALPFMRNFNLISSGFLSQYGMVFAAALEAPILLLALLQRSQVLHESQARARALERTEPLTGLTHRHHFLVRLHHSMVRAQRYGHSSALLLIHLDNHRELLAEYGREIADRALVIAASVLRSQARDVDTAARVDDDSFALLMEGPVRDEHAVATATALLAAGLRPSERLPVGETLRFKVVMALLPDSTQEPGRDAQACVDWLQQGMQSLAEERHKAILRLNF